MQDKSSDDRVLFEIRNKITLRFSGPLSEDIFRDIHGDESNSEQVVAGESDVHVYYYVSRIQMMHTDADNGVFDKSNEHQTPFCA